MKINKRQLQQLIKEEIENLLMEQQDECTFAVQLANSYRLQYAAGNHGKVLNSFAKHCTLKGQELKGKKGKENKKRALRHCKCFIPAMEHWFSLEKPTKQLKYMQKHLEILKHVYELEGGA